MQKGVTVRAWRLIKVLRLTNKWEEAKNWKPFGVQLRNLIKLKRIKRLKVLPRSAVVKIEKIQIVETAETQLRVQADTRV